MGDYVRQNKKQIVQEKFAPDEEKYPLLFQNLIDVQVKNVTFDAKPGENVSDIEGKMDVTYIVRYFTWNDLYKALTLYL